MLRPPLEVQTGLKIAVNTGTDYVVGYLYRELVAMRTIVFLGLEP